jgi:hypothetical protein
MSTTSVLDAAGRRRSPATMPGYHTGRPPRNKGIRYPADPPTVDEIVAVMRHAHRNSRDERERLRAPASPGRSSHLHASRRRSRGSSNAGAQESSADVLART